MVERNLLEINIFQNPSFGNVRCVEIDGEPWMVGRDVTDILGYGNGRDALAKHVDDEDKGVAKCDTLGGGQDLAIINESGLYALCLRSKLPNAKQFRRWVTSEVLPSIRKTGGYQIGISIPQDYPSALRALADEYEKNQSLTEENAAQKMMLSEYSPKASYYDVVLQTKDVVSISKIAKDYGKSAQWMNNYLRQKGIQYKQGDIWLLYQKYAEMGYTKSKTDIYAGNDGKQHSRMRTYWTQKGRLFIYELLKADGILPNIETDSPKTA